MSKIETMDDVKQWIARHDGRDDVQWTAQTSFNSDCAHDRRTLHSRVSALERRVMWIAGAASASGALIGSFLG